ncbi:MAG: sensor histidine kinase [Desulfurispora sp.]|uniref:sensor histidine kinase n=1 Tax=Desulfurispora sp. TaxID=3014275 RepID=UPI00404B58B5
MSVRLRLTLLYSLVLGLTLALFGLVVYFTMYRALSSEIDRNLYSRADTVTRQIRVSDSQLFSLQKIILPDVDVFATPGVYLQVVDNNGRLVAHSSNLGMQSLPLSEETLTLAREGKCFLETVQAGRQRLRVYNQPLFVGDRLAGILQVGQSLSQVQAVLLRLRILLTLIGLVMLLCAALLGWTLARAAFAPVERIIRAAAAIKSGSDLARRIEYRGPPDELGRLTETLNDLFNRMAQAYRRLEETNEAQRRFIADASHELRTPLTTIRGNAELLLKMGECDKLLMREALTDIAAEAQRLSDMVSELLTLARADAGQEVQMSPLELSELLSDVARSAQIIAEKVGFAADIQFLPAETCVEGNPALLKQLLLILLENAFKYTPPGGQVRLVARVVPEAAVVLAEWPVATSCRAGQLPAGTCVAISVQDSGMGIPAEDLPQIFERFYRSRHVRGISGTGLGLAIARWIAEMHRAGLVVQSVAGQGSAFHLFLPHC